MQDVCIPFWREDGTEDMMLKTPTSAAPILTTRATAQSQQTSKMGDQFPQKKTWWFFVKCWADVFTSFSIFALPNPKLLSLFTPPPQKNQLTPQFSTRHRASHNPPTKVQKQTIGSQLPTSPTTSTGPKPQESQEWNNTKSTKSPILKEAGQPIPLAHTIRKET